MAERFRVGDRVEVSTVDPPGHTRAPRYVRGAVGTVVELVGRYPLADDRAQGWGDVPAQPVYTVRFAAHDLWGAGDHNVAVDLWEAYLSPAPSGAQGEAHVDRSS